MMTDTPKISIITITLNAEAYLEQTIQSVLQQTYTAWEYFIIDGQSTDGTLEIIQRYAPRLTRWVSEADAGIADAMNKGIGMASGDYVLFLHADDYLAEPTSLAMAVAKIVENSADIQAFSIYYQTATTQLHYQPRAWNAWVYFKTPLWHQGVLCKRRLFNQIGLFDTRLKIAMDYDFFLRAYHYGVTVQRHQNVLSVMRDTGISSRQDWQSLRKRFYEERDIHYRHCTDNICYLLYRLYWSLYLPYRWLRYRITP